MVKDAIDWSGCPMTERDSEKMGGVSTVRAWRLSADSIVENHDSGATPEEISEWFEVPVEDVQTILAYAKQMPLCNGRFRRRNYAAERSFSATSSESF